MPALCGVCGVCILTVLVPKWLELSVCTYSECSSDDSTQLCKNKLFCFLEGPGLGRGLFCEQLQLEPNSRHFTW